MSVHYFEYNGKRSDSITVSDDNILDLTFGYFNTYEPPLNMTRNILKGSINRYRSTPNHMGTLWADVLTFNVNIIKTPCNADKNRLYFTEDEVNYINTWLTSPDYPMLLHIYDSEDTTYIEDPVLYSNDLFMKYDYFGLFTDIQPVYVGGEIMGLGCVFTTNSPFAWTKEYEETYQANSLGQISPIPININHAEATREIYPTIVIDTKTNSSISDNF